MILTTYAVIIIIEVLLPFTYFENNEIKMTVKLTGSMVDHLAGLRHNMCSYK